MRLNEEMSTQERTPQQGNTDRDLEEVLLVQWLDDVFEKTVPNQTVHRDAWTNMLIDARKSRRPVILLGLGCLDWITVSDLDGTGVDVVQELKPKGRSRQFAETIGEMQCSLHSFGVPTIIFLSLSNIDPLISAGRGEMGADFTTSTVTEIFERSLETMISLLHNSGGVIRGFNHFEIVANTMQVEDPEAIFEKIAQSEDISIEEFLFRLYRRDIENLPQEIVGIARQDGIDPQGVVWLDMMSPLAGEHREHMIRTLTDCRPNLPAINPSANSGKWNTRAVGREHFQDKISFLSQRLETPATPNRAEWMRQILSKSDREIADFMKTLGVEIQITSMKTKNTAAAMLEKLVWGDSSFIEQDLVQSVSLPAHSTVVEAVSAILGQPRNHARNLIRDGVVRVDSRNITNFCDVVHNGATVAIGRKTKAKVTIKE